MTRIKLELETIPHGHPAPWIRRLARLLKALARGYGFRCVNVVADEKEETNEKTKDKNM